MTAYEQAREAHDMVRDLLNGGQCKSGGCHFCRLGDIEQAIDEAKHRRLMDGLTWAAAIVAVAVMAALIGAGWL